VTVPEKWVKEGYLSQSQDREESELNSHSHRIGTGADPDVVTLGPKQPVYHPEWDPYEGRHSISFKIPRKDPILAPIDMKLIGFSNRNAEYRVYKEGFEGSEVKKDSPFDDLQLWFRSQDPDYPNMVVTCYHLFSSPLLKGQMINPGCKRHESWYDDRPFPEQGHVFYARKDYHKSPTPDAPTCEPMMGKSVERGDLIGYGGTTGDGAHVSFGFKVYDEKVNPIIEHGNEHLHWVQPGAYFDWKCYSPQAEFGKNVLPYPFECGGYRVEKEKRDPYFKYEK